MDASLETLVVAAYVFACSLSIPRPGPDGLISDQELIALAVAQAITGLVSDRQFLGTVGRLLPGWFPHLPDQTQFNRRLRRLTPWTAAVQLSVAELVATGDVRLVDGTLLGCANYAGCASKSQFAGRAKEPRAPLTPGPARAPLGALRGRASRTPPGCPRSRLLRPGR
jgi:hypothetical protein